MSDASRMSDAARRQHDDQLRQEHSRNAVTELDPENPHRQTFATYHAVSYLSTVDGFEIDPDQTITAETDTTPKNDGENGGGAPATAPPVNRDVPAVSGPDGLTSALVGQTLNCTMGNWDNEPTGYTYQWKSGSTNVGLATSNNSYVVEDADAGRSVTCVVTATNAIGSTAAPPSNAVAVS